MEPTRKPLRIDFAPDGARCSYPGCNHHIERAHVVLEGDREVLYGSECIQKVLSEEQMKAFSDLPNFTRRARIAGTSGSRQASQDGAHAGKTSELSLALEYLHLRLKIIPKFCSPALRRQLEYGPWAGIWERLQSNGWLPWNDVRHILAIEKKTRTEKPAFQLRNLRDAYTAHVKLTRKRKKATSPRAIAFYDNLLNSLSNTLRLSPAQAGKAELKLPKTAFGNRG